MSLHILHLEDNLLDAELILANLLDFGFDCEIVRVETREDFTSAVEKGEFDIILADYSLPSFDGIAALKIAHEIKPDVPFIIISGALGEELAIETLKGGATDYILKHRLERLVPSVNRALRESSERAARRQAERDRELLLESEQEARRKAEEANRLKDEFLATVSHELRTPLNAILGWASMMRKGYLDDATTAQAVETIERNARAQCQLIEDLLDVSRIITGKLRLEVTAVDLAALVRSAVDSIRPAAEAKKIEIQTGFGENSNTIFGDPDRLQQIVWNLLSNAVKFTPVEGRVGIYLRRGDHHSEIIVCDNGEGIATEFLPFVFDRFRQEEGSTTRQHGGLGLGLALVKHLAEMHGGTVQASSDGRGCGATFTVRLPQVAHSAQPQSELLTESETRKETVSANGNQSLSNLKILAVDDDRDSRELLQLMLERHGATVTVAESASEALNRIEELQPDVLVSDVGMPVEDGYGLLGKIRGLSTDKIRQTPAIALTGFAREEDRIRAIAAGFDAHVSKPIDPATLVQTISQIVNSTDN